MKTVTIKRTRGDVPLMVFITGVALFPGLYIMYENSAANITFILAALFTVLIIMFSVFCFRIIFKHHSRFILTKEGVKYEDNDRKNVSAAFFYRWEDIKSYQIVTKTDRYYSNETNTYQENDVHSISLTLENGSAILVSADKLSKRPAEIIELFELYKRAIK